MIIFMICKSILQYQNSKIQLLECIVLFEIIKAISTIIDITKKNFLVGLFSWSKDEQLWWCKNVDGQAAALISLLRILYPPVICFFRLSLIVRSVHYCTSCLTWTFDIWSSIEFSHIAFFEPWHVLYLEISKNEKR